MNFHNLSEFMWVILNTHRDPRGWYIYPTIYHPNQPNVGKLAHLPCNLPSKSTQGRQIGIFTLQDPTGTYIIYQSHWVLWVLLLMIQELGQPVKIFRKCRKQKTTGWWDFPNIKSVNPQIFNHEIRVMCVWESPCRSIFTFISQVRCGHIVPENPTTRNSLCILVLTTSKRVHIPHPWKSRNHLPNLTSELMRVTWSQVKSLFRLKGTQVAKSQGNLS